MSSNNAVTPAIVVPNRNRIARVFICPFLNGSNASLNHSVRVRVKSPVFTQVKCYWWGIVHSNDKATDGTMPSDEKMTIDERRKYLRRMQVCDAQANQDERSHLLDEMEAVTERHRKNLIRLLKGDLERRPPQKQRGRAYGGEVDDTLRVISESFDSVCAEWLTPNLGWMARHLARQGELTVSARGLEPLEQVSIATVRRILQRRQQDPPHLPRQAPERANQVSREIPMKRLAWPEAQPGSIESRL